MENLKRNIYQLKNNISLFLVVIFLSSCSSMESLKFWENGEVDIDEPKKLEKFPIFELNKSKLPDDFRSSILKLDNELKGNEFNQEKLKKAVEEIGKRIILFNEI